MHTEAAMVSTRIALHDDLLLASWAEAKSSECSLKHWGGLLELRMESSLTCCSQHEGSEKGPAL